MRHLGRVAAAVVVAAIGLYQRWVSPALGPRCRYWPSCSEYARLAIARWGLLRGGARALGRLLRCQPAFPGGIDPPR
jgi:putative membrane protein insertion efficiency factor